MKTPTAPLVPLALEAIAVRNADLKQYEAQEENCLINIGRLQQQQQQLQKQIDEWNALLVKTRKDVVPLRREIAALLRRHWRNAKPSLPRAQARGQTPGTAAAGQRCNKSKP